MMKEKFSQKGVSLVLTIIVMAILLTMIFGLTTISIVQIKVLTGLENSVIAFSAANTGIERELYTKNASGTSYSGYLDLNKNGFQDEGDSSYNVLVIAPGENGCPPNVNFCITSVGIYRGTRRAIQVSR